MSTKIIIVDDHSIFREGLKLLIETEGMGKVIAEAKNGQEFLNLLERFNPELVLMDIKMPDICGVEATKKAIAIRPDLKILMVTMQWGMENYFETIKAGAMGYILKTSGKKELEKAIETVVRGECYFSNGLLRQIIKNDGRENLFPERLDNEDFEFTEREHVVLQFLCNGFTALEISDKMFLSIKTIEFYRSSLLKKTKTKHTLELVVFAIKKKLFKLE